MAWVAVAIGGAAVIGGTVNAIDSSNAANAQTSAANQSTNAQLAEYNQTRADNQPWVDSGKTNLAALNSQMPDLTRKFTMSDFQQDPGYQFQLAQGTQAMQRSAAAKGLLNSVGTQQNLNNYAQGMANTDYQQALGNFTNNQTQRYNMLAGLSSNGQTAVGQVGNAGQNAANNISANTIASGNASSAASIASGNAINGTLQSGVNGYLNYNMMKNLTTSPGGGAPVSMPSLGSSSVGGGSPSYGTALGDYQF